MRTLSNGDIGVSRLRVVVTMPGAPDQTLALEAGDFVVPNGGFTRAVRNDGAETTETGGSGTNQ